MKFCKFYSILLFKGILLEDNVIMCYFRPIMILHITQNLGKKKHEASSTFEAKKNFQVPIHFKTSARR